MSDETLTRSMVKSERCSRHTHIAYEPANKRSRDAETLVAQALEAQGWTILARNFRIVGSELDIVAHKGDTLAFIEVKARSRKPVTLEEVAGLLPNRKKQALLRGATAYLGRITQTIPNARFDLALVWGTKAPYGMEYFVNIL